MRNVMVGIMAMGLMFLMGCGPQSLSNEQESFSEYGGISVQNTGDKGDIKPYLGTEAILGDKEGEKPHLGTEATLDQIIPIDFCADFNMSIRFGVKSCLFALIEAGFFVIPDTTYEEYFNALIMLGAPEYVADWVLIYNAPILFGIMNQERIIVSADNCSIQSGVANCVTFTIACNQAWQVQTFPNGNVEYYNDGTCAASPL